MSQPDAAQLHQFIVDYFNLDELKTLCFNLGVEYDDLGGDGRSGKARELVLSMQRQLRLDHLVAYLSLARLEAYRRRFPEKALISAFPPASLFPSTTAPSSDHRIHEKTSIELIRIPAGPFLYGSSHNDNMASDNEKPQLPAYLPEYWISRAPVTNAQFAYFVQVTGYKTMAEVKGKGRGWKGSWWGWIKGANWRHPSGPKSSIEGKDEHPMVQVSWHDALAFCHWTGLILPSEVQWEKAARGTDGRIWPWGNELPTDKHCNFNRNIGDTTPVGMYSPLGDSPFGCVDVSGNVWEWTDSWYEEGATRVLRGGSWNYVDRFTRATHRGYNNPSDWNNLVGFRVAEFLSDPGL